ncbi:ArdC family protein [Aquisediminimonas profunda]|uniref:ArdC family protein n=1 Tax=Aquisediminimonas profunda TaxID=1550733 RepID=UPI001C62D6FC|nr:zincin-like metallopeptidase domain-containing protein [Aquisediminimonas profunda]
MTNSSHERFNVYGAITDQIIAAIEAGAEHPQMPWHRAGGSIQRPTNIESRKAYQGVNTVALWAAADARGFAHGLWGTYRQWQEKGAQVRKGEKSSVIIFYRDLESNDRDAQSSGDDDRNNRFFVARASRVFNVAQVDGFELPAIEPAIDRIDPCVTAEAFVAATNAKITVAGDRAFYNRATDSITMPDRHRFVGTKTSTVTESWYSTLLHELTHWSGAESRCARTFGERFGDDAYAMEEMVAELGAAFLCGDLGITAEPRVDHADYIGHWLRILKGDRKAIFTAASAANKASEYLKSLAGAEHREAA